MQAPGTVDGDVRTSFFCKYLLSSRSCDWDIAVHIKEHHITCAADIIQTELTWQDLNEPNQRWRGTVFLTFAAHFQSRSPLFLHLDASAAPPLCPNCMAWPKPLKIALLERAEREGWGGRWGRPRWTFFCLFFHPAMRIHPPSPTTSFSPPGC